MMKIATILKDLLQVLIEVQVEFFSIKSSSTFRTGDCIINIFKNLTYKALKYMYT